MSKTMFGYQQYTVVSPVYNVSDYLEDYFTSITDQQLDFKNNIHLVMVDDGSTDDSAQIIKHWQMRFPENITYVYKENGGLSSARNTGLGYVKTEWVTFIDPDDFIDIGYFLEVDSLLKAHQTKNLQLLSCNLIFYYENKKQFSDTHALNFRFAKGDVVLACDNLEKHIQLSVNSAFFKMHLILEKSLHFDSKIFPNFEDGHFVGIYLKNLQDSGIAFSNKAKYFYRKRSDGTSLIDTSWKNKGRYSSIFVHGYIQLLERYYTDYGFVPSHIQRTVLYDLIWYLKVLVNKPEVVAFLSDADRNNFAHYFEQALAFIEPETILSFELAGCWFFHKVGLIEGFKQAKLPFQIVYVEDYDPIKSQVQLRYFSVNIGFEQFSLDGEDVLPHFAKTMHHDFLERTFVRERRIWLPLSQINQKATLKVQIGEYDARITLGGKQHKDGLKTDDIRKHFKSKEIKHNAEPRFSGSWLFMDRETQADDNAEHLYRYVQANYPERNIYFVLCDDSHDWARLEKLGFNLLAYGSAEHESALRSCGKIISSHADVYVVNYFKDYSLDDKQFIFLQHGVIKDDLSSWLNSKKRIDCFITSALPEFKSISSDESRYKYTKKEVNLTGLPRHDALINSTVATEKLIVIMPTWRKYLIGNVVSGSVREIHQDFIHSEYAQAWLELLKSSELAELSKKHDYKIVYFPHSNFQPYIEQFVLPEYIDVLNHQNCSIQDLFLQAALMITDYSSVAFEMAFLQKPTLYYQFDEDQFFKGEHVFQKGYFDYRQHGFGPVATQEAELIDTLTHLLEQDAKPDLVYQTRIAEFFSFRDGRNCERVYEAILALDQPMPDDFIDIEILKNAAENAYKVGKWDVAQSRLEQYVKLTNDVDSKEKLSNLDQIGIEYGIDQSSKQHDYLKLYQERLSALNKPFLNIVILSNTKPIETANTFAKFYQNSIVHILSLKPLTQEQCASCLSNVNITLCTTFKSIKMAILKISNIDVLIDDGTNKKAQKCQFFNEFFMMLNNRGLYVVEDLHASYLERFIDIEGDNVWQRINKLIELKQIDQNALKTKNSDDVELSTAISSMTSYGKIAFITKQGQHFYKLQESISEEVLSSKAGSKYISMLVKEKSLEANKLAFFRQTSSNLANQMPKEKYEIPEIRIREIKNVLCQPGQVAVIDNLILPDTFRFHCHSRLLNRNLINCHQNFARLKINFDYSLDIKGNYFYLDNELPEHFGHFTLEVLSRMWAFEKIKEKYPDIKILMSSHTSDAPAQFQQDILKVFGIHHQDIVCIRQPVRVENLVTATSLFALARYAASDLLPIWQKISDFFNKREVSAPKIFVSRSGGYSRKCKNQTEVEAFFIKHGFKVIYPEKMNIEEQVNVFANATVVAGFASSAMLNAIYCPKNITKIIIQSESFEPINDLLISLVKNDDYHHFWCPAEVLKNPKQWSFKAFNSDYSFDFEKNGDILEELLLNL